MLIRFTTTGELANAYLNHDGSPLVCGVCGYQIGQGEYYTRHQAPLQAGTGRGRPTMIYYACSFCYKFHRVERSENGVVYSTGPIPKLGPIEHLDTEMIPAMKFPPQPVRNSTPRPGVPKPTRLQSMNPVHKRTNAPDFTNGIKEKEWIL